MPGLVLNSRNYSVIVATIEKKKSGAGNCFWNKEKETEKKKPPIKDLD